MLEAIGFSQLARDSILFGCEKIPKRHTCGGGRRTNQEIVLSYDSSKEVLMCRRRLKQKVAVARNSSGFPARLERGSFVFVGIFESWKKSPIKNAS